MTTQSEYPNATWQRQQQITAQFKQYTLGLFHFFATDPASPPELRAKMGSYGLCRDEHTRSGHWPFQMCAAALGPNAIPCTYSTT